MTKPKLSPNNAKQVEKQVVEWLDANHKDYCLERDSIVIMDVQTSRSPAFNNILFFVTLECPDINNDLIDELEEHFDKLDCDVLVEIYPR